MTCVAGRVQLEGSLLTATTSLTCTGEVHVRHKFWSDGNFGVSERERGTRYMTVYGQNSGTHMESRSDGLEIDSNRLQRKHKAWAKWEDDVVRKKKSDGL